MIGIGLTSLEYEILKEKSAKHHMTISDFVRFSIKEYNLFSIKESPEIAKELRRIDSQILQCRKQVNQNYIAYVFRIEDDIKRLSADIAKIKTSLQEIVKRIDTYEWKAYPILPEAKKSDRCSAYLTVAEHEALVYKCQEWNISLCDFIRAVIRGENLIVATDISKIVKISQHIPKNTNWIAKKLSESRIVDIKEEVGKINSDLSEIEKEALKILEIAYIC